MRQNITLKELRIQTGTNQRTKPTKERNNTIPPWNQNLEHTIPTGH